MITKGCGATWMCIRRRRTSSKPTSGRNNFQFVGNPYPTGLGRLACYPPVATSRFSWNCSEIRNIFQLHSVEIHMLMKMWMLGALCLLVTATALSAQTKDVSCSAFSGTWFGSFRIVTPDGKSTRDNAVIVLTGDCGNMTGSAGSNIDQQSPISGVQFTSDEIRFHMEPMGGLDFQLKRQ